MCVLDATQTPTHSRSGYSSERLTLSTAEARVRRAAISTILGDGRPDTGEAILVAPGIYWVRMRLPMQLNHINLYLLEDGDGWTVVDSGIKNEETQQAWEKLFAGPMGGRKVKRVIVTHMHPDHIGLAGWLVRKFDVELWITRTEYLMCRNLAADTGEEAPVEALRFYRAAGFPEDLLENYRTRFGGFGMGVYRLPNAFRRIVEGDVIDIGPNKWRVVGGNGHSPHACLWCPELTCSSRAISCCRRSVERIGASDRAGSEFAQTEHDSCNKLRASCRQRLRCCHTTNRSKATLRLQEL